VAYATEATLIVLIGASLASASLVVPISIAIAALLAIVVASYRQTIEAYPNGGGAYVVAKENLGVPFGLVAAASLLVDYVLTVAVSVASGVLAVTSAVPVLGPYRLELSLACIGLLVLANLRGVRESGRLFAAPTYLFIGSVGLLIVVGVVKVLLGSAPQAVAPDPLPAGAAATVGIAVILRAFASGCSALTGVEAISNGVTAFRHPQPRNAARTLVLMGGIAIFLFLGVSVLAEHLDARPSSSVSVLSEIARAVFPAGGLSSSGYWLVQLSTFAVLVLAANTAFQGFPRLSALLARDEFLPRQFTNLGDRLVFSNGMLVLAGAASVLLVVFDASVDRLIQLYLVGVFTAFTLSQAGMVRRWWRSRATRSRAAILKRVSVNGLGAITTGIVTLVVISTKFSEGAWMVLVAIPVLVGGSYAVRRHYARVGREIAASKGRVRPRTGRPGPIVLVVEGLDQATATALALVKEIAGGHLRERVRAVHVPGRESGITQEAWRAFAGSEIPLHVLRGGSSRRRGGVLHYVRQMRREPGEQVTVVIPEQLRRRSLLEAMRRGSFALKLRLLSERQVVTCSVPAVSGEPSVLAEHPRVVAVPLVSGLTLPALRALDYARTLTPDETWALSVALDEDDRERLERAWAESGLAVPLEVIDAPYRDLGRPLVAAIREITADPSALCLVVMPEVIVRGRLRRLLHNQRAFFIKRVLLFEPRVVLASVPYHVS
jgi:amino acid transporter